MRTETEIVEDIELLSKDLKIGRDILRRWDEYELYPGQFAKQSEFVKSATECGLLPLAEDA